MNGKITISESEPSKNLYPRNKDRKYPHNDKIGYKFVTVGEYGTLQF